MTDVRLKSRIGFLIVGWHFFLFILILVLRIIGGFSFEQMTTIWALLTPVLGVYIGSIIKYFISRKEAFDRGKRVSQDYSRITYILVVGFLGVLTLIVVLSAFRLGITFAQTKTVIGLIEGAFGAYFGMVMSSLFEVERKNGGDG